MTTNTDVLGNTYGVGDIVAIAHYDTTMRCNQQIIARIEKIEPSHETVKVTPLFISDKFMDTRNTGKVRTYINTERILALPNMSYNDVIALKNKKAQ